jgi:hypothetical protein
MAESTITIDVEIPTAEIDEEAIAAWIEARLNDARNGIIRQLSRGAGGGRVYRRGRQYYHQASAPGEYPVSDSGRLAGSVHSVMNGTRSGSLYSELNYAGYLTTGTRYMAARKMLRDALEEALAAVAEDELAQQGVKFE